jgi:hypothetical protein
VVDGIVGKSYAGLVILMDDGGLLLLKSQVSK